MSENIQIFIYGSLRNRGNDSSNPPNTMLPVGEANPLKNIISKLGIQADKVQMAICNHRAVSKEATIKTDDCVALFPSEYPIYPDWNDLVFEWDLFGFGEHIFDSVSLVSINEDDVVVY